MKTSFLYKAILILMLIPLVGCATTRTRDEVLLLAETIRSARSEQLISEPVSVASISLPAYEKLTFQAKYLGITVGTMTTEIKGISEIKGRDAYHFEVTARTNKFFSKFFKVEDRFVSYMDVERLHVLRQEIYRREGNYRKSAIVDFDQVNHKAYYRHLTNNSSEVIDIPENVQDVVTANYFVRIRPWSVGDTLEFSVYVDEKVYTLLGLIKSKTRLRVPGLGRQQAFVFQPYAQLDGAEVKEGKASGYFSMDPYRTPLKGQVKTPVFGSASIIYNQGEYTSN